MVARGQDAVAVHPGRDGVIDIIGRAAENGDRGQECMGVGGSLEKARYDAGAVHPEQAIERLHDDLPHPGREPDHEFVLRGRTVPFGVRQRLQVGDRPALEQQVTSLFLDERRRTVITIGARVDRDQNKRHGPPPVASCADLRIDNLPV